jgi:DNA-binding transcriptional LysR family regulator
VTDLRRLEYFLGVARERNSTRAAEQLHVAQPAVSRQVTSAAICATARSGCSAL